MKTRKKSKIDKDTYEELSKKARERSKEIKQNALEQLKFLEEYGCKVYINQFNNLLVEYKEHGRYQKVANIRVPMSYNYKYSTCEFVGKFYVDFNYSVCHNTKDSYLTLEDIIKTLADRII